MSKPRPGPGATRGARPSRTPRTWDPPAIESLLHRLERNYGRADWEQRFEPMDELVSCILSQHTSDANSFPAFYRLKGAYPTWDKVAAAPAGELADVIRAAGLANQKARNIQACLREIRDRNGGYDIENLRAMPFLEAREWLTSLPGVGPKTASIVLSFAFGMEAIPVDTHVYRVAWRIGLIPEGVGEAKAHDLLLERVPKGLGFRLHMALIQHGREVCKAPLPLCERCLASDVCRWFRRDGPAKRRKELRAKRGSD